MSIVLITVVSGDFRTLDAHIAFHLNAGVDVVIADAVEPDDGVTEVLERYERSGHVHRDSGSLTELSRLAVAEYRAEWVLPDRT